MDSITQEQALIACMFPEKGKEENWRRKKAEVMKLMECVQSKEDPLIQSVRTHKLNTNSNS
jgi:undecaprenyl pyrophosphate synthase